MLVGQFCLVLLHLVTQPYLKSSGRRTATKWELGLLDNPLPFLGAWMMAALSCLGLLLTVVVFEREYQPRVSVSLSNITGAGWLDSLELRLG